MWEDIAISSFKQPKQEGITCPNQTFMQLFSFLKIYYQGNKETQNFMKKSAFLDLSILELSKIVMHEFWYC